MEVIGVHHFWGFTPALDLQTVYNQTVREADESDSALVIVLVDVGDIRHVLKTVAQRWRHGLRKLQVCSLPAQNLEFRDFTLAYTDTHLWAPC